MGSEEEIGDRVFQQRNVNSNILNCPSSVMTTDSISDHFYSSGWDQTGNYSSQNEFANPHFPVVMQNQSMVHFPSDSGLVVPSFGSGSFSEMVISSFGHMDESFHQNQGIGIQKTSVNNNTVDSQENCQNSEDGFLGAASPNGKRKRRGSLGASSKNVEVEQQHKDHIGEASEFPKQDEKKNIGGRGKQAVKETKENSNGGEASKDNYIHVRAKRGQATNSHSLAERVRREKISERMRLLQELVPGCNKITGKAVMLDEIINYVQSLQQQVEFLSMKLATVNPEINVDIERLLAKDILHPRGTNANALGIGPGLNSSLPFQGLSQVNINSFPGTNPPFHPLPQNLWNNELQNILQMGFNPNPSVSNLETNGLSKMEL